MFVKCSFTAHQSVFWGFYAGCSKAEGKLGSVDSYSVNKLAATALTLLPQAGDGFLFTAGRVFQRSVVA